MRNRARVSSATRGGWPGQAGQLARRAAGQPASGRGAHLRVRRSFRPQVQSGPVGGDRFHADRRAAPDPAGGARGQRGAYRVGETVRAHPGRDHVLRGPLQPDDLMRGRARQVAEFVRRGQRLRGEAGVHAQHGNPGRRQEPLAHLGRAELGSPGRVVGQLGVRRQAEDRRAQPAEREPGLRVEHRAARPARALVQHRLERGLVGVPAQHPVAVVIDQRLFGDAGEQCFPFARLRGLRI